MVASVRHFVFFGYSRSSDLVIVFSFHTRKHRFQKHSFQTALLWRAFSNGSFFGDRFRCCSVDDNRIRSKTAQFSFENGLVCTEPEKAQSFALWTDATPGNTVSLYADDCKTSREINCPVDHILFQSDIDNIYRWSLQNRMEFNVKKCKLMRICKNRSPLLSDLHLNNSTLQSTTDFCDLGLVTTCNLSWNSHIDKITSKAKRILGLIKRTCRGLKDVPTLRTLYLALVRSQLEFCSVV